MSSDDMEYGFSQDRLATTDETGNRVYIHPEDIKGKWRSLRTKFYWLLIGFYLILPWIYIDGKQLILLDIPKREFHLFGNIYYGHDGPLAIFIILGFVFGIGLVSTIWGRVWCGWACPQTVFIDAIYRRLEQFAEGKSRKRRDLDRSPWNFNKIWRKSLKWSLFTIVSAHIVHSFLGYFVGTHKLFLITTSSPYENWSLFITMIALTGALVFNFGWFKEQFCIIACPYGRFQSFLMDDSSTIVAFEEARGTPIRNPKVIQKEDEGDCIDCKRCVKVCPTGIDIRKGTQMECITCTQCIDACDEIMVKLKRPKGLIKYTTENELNNKPNKTSPRVYVYIAILLTLALGFVYSLSLREGLRTQFLRGSKTPYQVITLAAGSQKIVNHFNVKFNYYGQTPYHLNIVIADPKYRDQIEVIMPMAPVNIVDDNKSADIFFKFDKGLLVHGSLNLKVQIINSEDLDTDPGRVLQELEVKLVGPIN